MRLFIAIPIEDKTQKLLEENINKTQSEIKEDLKWVRGENLHLTLKFLGETNPNKVDDIKEAISNTCSKFDKFNIYYNHFNAFPSTNYPKVLYFGLNDNKKTLINLQNELDENLAKKGFSKDNRDFTPHLTFARSRKRTNMNKLKDNYNYFINNNEIRILQKVNTISLIESKLYRSGPVYQELFSYNLN